MAKQTATIIEQKYNALPIGIGRKGFLTELIKVGISERTWDRDRIANPNSIPVDRLKIYAGLFGCDITELIDTYTKVKPLVKRTSLAKSIGLKS